MKPETEHRVPELHDCVLGLLSTAAPS